MQMASHLLEILLLFVPKEDTMKLKGILISSYFAIGLIYALYSWLFGAYTHASLAYNLGRGLVWPASMFPTVGTFIGGIILVVIIGAFALNRR